MIPRQDLLDARSPAGIEVFQLTSEAVPSCHVYMEAQVFTLDSNRFVLHRSAHPHGSDRRDPEHRYLLCDLEAGPKAALAPLTTECGVTAPSISPDGRWLYYLVDETDLDAGRLTLRRVKLDGSGRETILVVDAPPRGSRFRPSRIYPLSSISSDGQRLAAAAYLGDGRTNYGPWGLLVFDLQKASVDVVLSGQSWCNLHPQYSRSLDPRASHDILVQENHGNVCDAQGNFTKLVGGRHDGGLGCDIHVIRDDGSDFRNLPWGRDAHEYCQGHQCWRGRGDTAITTAGLMDATFEPARRAGETGRAKVWQEQIVEGSPCPYDGHRGLLSAGGHRNLLSRNVENPRFFHFATDLAGQRFVTDANPGAARGWDIHLAAFGKPMVDPLLKWTFLLDSRTATTKGSHPHPFLSPDGRMAFFNSDESGVMQAYMIRNLPAL